MGKSRRTFGSIRQLASGRFQARYTTPDGEMITVGLFQTRTLASRALAQIETEMSKGTWVNPRDGDLKFEEWFERWLTSNDIRSTTIRHYRSTAKHHFFPIIGRVPLNKVKPSDIQNLVNGWRINGKRNRAGERTGSGLSPQSVRNNYALLASIFSAAAKDDLIGKSPCRLTMTKPVARKVPDVTMTDLAAFADAVGERYGPMVWLAGILGLRIGEIGALLVSDIDFLHRRLTVNKAHSTINGKVEVVLPKTEAGNRTMTVPLPVIEILAEHVARYQLSASDLVFTTQRGNRPVRQEHFDNRVWAPAREALGFAGLHFHDLRHVATTMMIEAGVHPKVMATRLGHASALISLDVYGRTSDAADAAASALIEAQMKASVPLRATSTADVIMGNTSA